MNERIASPEKAEVSSGSRGAKAAVLQFLKFVCFSLGAGIIEFVSFTVINLFCTRETLWIAEVASVVLSCLFNFTLNRKYTFQSASNLYLGMALYGLYYAVATPLGVQFISFLIDSGWNEYLAKITKMLLNFILDFSYCKFFIFRIGKKKAGDAVRKDSV